MEQQQPQEADDVAAPSSSSLLDAACLLGAALSDGASLTVSTALAVSRCARVRARLAAQLSPDSLAGVLVNVEEAAMHMHGIKRAALSGRAFRDDGGGGVSGERHAAAAAHDSAAESAAYRLLTAGDAILAARELRGTLLRPTPEEEAFWSGFIARRLCDNAGVAYARLEDCVATRGAHAARTHATVGGGAAARLDASGEGDCGYAALLSVASLAALLLRCQLWRSPAPPADAVRTGRRHRAAAAAAAAAAQQQRRSAVEAPLLDIIVRALLYILALFISVSMVRRRRARPAPSARSSATCAGSESSTTHDISALSATALAASSSSMALARPPLPRALFIAAKLFIHRRQLTLRQRRLARGRPRVVFPQQRLQRQLRRPGGLRGAAQVKQQLLPLDAGRRVAARGARQAELAQRQALCARAAAQRRRVAARRARAAQRVTGRICWRWRSRCSGEARRAREWREHGRRRGGGHRRHGRLRIRLRAHRRK
jgi:hypothetical protein